MVSAKRRSSSPIPRVQPIGWSLSVGRRIVGGGRASATRVRGRRPAARGGHPRPEAVMNTEFHGSSQSETEGGARAIEVLTLFEDTIVEARHFDDPDAG